MLRKALLALPLFLGAHPANAWIHHGSIGPTIDAYFSVTDGIDTPPGQNRLGIDCIKTAPCQTPQKWLDFHADQVANNPNRSYVYGFDARTPFYGISKTLLYTPAHTVNAPYTTTILPYNGSQALWSAGFDTAGTWFAAGLNGSNAMPNGATGCVSSFLTNHKPLVGQNAKFYVGNIWYLGDRRQEVRNPRVGQQWARIPGPVASFTQTSSTIGIADLSKIGNVGDKIGFQSTVAGYIIDKMYFILTKSGTTGPGTITIGLTATSPALVSNSTATAITEVGPTIGSHVYAYQTGTLTAGSADIQIPALDKIQEPGDDIQFEVGLGNFNTVAKWVIYKSAQKGAGVIRVSATRGSSVPLVATVSGPLNVKEHTQSINAGDRQDSGQNRFPYNAAVADFKTGHDQLYVKAMLGNEPLLAEVSSVDSVNHVITLDSGPKAGRQLYAGEAYQVWNKFEDLGSHGYTGETWTSHDYGFIYTTPKPGETCASYNVPGTTIIPGPLETIMRISNSLDDIANAGGSAAGVGIAQRPGRLIVQNITFSHTNSAIFSDNHTATGDVGGFVTEEASHYGSGDPALDMVGAQFVTLDGFRTDNIDGAGVFASWGSSDLIWKNGGGVDAGATFGAMGANITGYDTFHHNLDPGYLGTAAFGPTTPMWTSAPAVSDSLVDFTGGHDNNIVVTNNAFQGAGKIFTGGACLSFAVWQTSEFTWNKMTDCPGFGLVAGNQGATAKTAPSYQGLIGAAKRGSTYYYPSFGNKIEHNEIARCGFETSTTGVPIPGASMESDFGCLYVQGPNDGDGTQTPLSIQLNVVHDISCGISPDTAGGAISTFLPYLKDAVLDYHDGNNSMGIIEQYNVFYNLPYTSIGDGTHKTCPIRITQHTGNARFFFQNNILFGDFAAGFSSTLADGQGGYSFLTNVPPFAFVYQGSGATMTCTVAAPCYTYNQSYLYIATASGILGTNTRPSCTTPGCISIDGQVTWTLLGDLPTIARGNPYGTWRRNIFAGTIDGASGLTSEYFGGASFDRDPYFFEVQQNMYSIECPGCVLGKFNGAKTFTQWQAIVSGAGNPEDATSIFGRNVSPDASGIRVNFVDPAHGNFNFNGTYSGAGTSYACPTTLGAPAGMTSPSCGPNVGFIPFPILTGPQ